jgi:hypothetical protein
MLIVRLEGLGQLKNPMTSSEIEHTTFGLVAQCLKLLRYSVPPPPTVTGALQQSMLGTINSDCFSMMDNLSDTEC